ncbi:MAG: hypothetical protein GF317_23465 [Candidatus Lokiarchaeota archaeon]|nr:hypothetical protein [Candidatus Lokiarchaeota archaeon]
MFKNNYFRNHFFKLFQAFIFPFMLNFQIMAVEEQGAGSVAEQKLLEKVKEKTSNTVDEKMKEYANGMITAEKFTEEIDSLKADMQKFPDLSEKYETIKGILEKQGEIINQVKMEYSHNKKELSKADKISLLTKAVCQSDEFKKFVENGFEGRTKKFSFKDKEINEKAVSIADDYSGDILITSPSGRVIDTPNRDVNIRDILSVTQTDQPNIVGQEVYDWSDEFNGSTEMLTENESAPEGDFEVKENTWGIKRIAAFYDLSKTMLKTNGVRWLVSHLSNVLPKKVKFTEDWQLLFGDGNNDNLKGMTIDATEVDLSEQSIVAGNVSSVATYNSGTQSIITFSAGFANSNTLRSGDTLTIANSANYNGTYKGVIKVSKTQVIIDKAYLAEATAAWTGNFKNPFYNAIDNAQEYDALRVVASYMNYRDRMIDGFVMNPVDAAKIDLLKGLDAQYVGIARDGQGILRVMGLPIIETTAMPANRFVGIRSGAENMELAEFTPLSLYFTDDVSYAKSNKVAAIIEEEVIFPIYEPKSVVYGKLDDVISDLETP